MIKLLEDYLDNEKLFWDYKTSNSDIDKCDIFDTTVQETSYGKDFVDYANNTMSEQDKKYFEQEKNKCSEIVYMTPQEYYDKCAEIFTSRKGEIVTSDDLKNQRASYEQGIEKLKTVLNKYHKKFPIAYIDYADMGQEGLHRMLVAGEICGWNTKFPVLVIKPFNEERHKQWVNETNKSEFDSYVDTIYDIFEKDIYNETENDIKYYIDKGYSAEEIVNELKEYSLHDYMTYFKEHTDYLEDMFDIEVEYNVTNTDTNVYVDFILRIQSLKYGDLNTVIDTSLDGTV